jgi:hypothetical protein
MAHIDVKPPTVRKRLWMVLGVVGGIIVLMLLGWGIGFTAHRMLTGYRRPAPTETESPAATLTTLMPVVTPTAPPPTGVSTEPPTEEPTPVWTSTPLPTEVPTPTEAVVGSTTVQAGEGLYQVCRRHCPGRWPEGGVPPDLGDYARQVAEENQLEWGQSGPTLSRGQELTMPPCP